MGFTPQQGRRTEYAGLNIRHGIRKLSDVRRDGQQANVPERERFLELRPPDHVASRRRVTDTHSWLFRFPLRLGCRARLAVIVMFSVMERMADRFT